MYSNRGIREIYQLQRNGAKCELCQLNLEDTSFCYYSESRSSLIIMQRQFKTWTIVV